jgi:hypothetical protein
MSDPKQALQNWIITTLIADSPPIVEQMFDIVPRSDPFPRGTIGPGQTIPGDDDGQCESTWEVFQQIDFWSRSPGYSEVSAIAGAVKDALHHVTPTLDGYEVVLLEWLSTDYSRDSDGLTSRARMQFRALIDDATT